MKKTDFLVGGLVLIILLIVASKLLFGVALLVFLLKSTQS